ncbi:hypothetical protein AALP_AA4G107000 [Arabis alpina]|uniref:Uncharacterized protein n=1 Tax=Arabis alpina TaxID=50452 RepID=A0A087H2G6_ARAAL|nr:hypothetical protein AALP_AA4G107000 [Arabis alpina]
MPSFLPDLSSPTCPYTMEMLPRTGRRILTRFLTPNVSLVT